VLPPVEDLQRGDRRGEWIDYSTLDAQATGEVPLPSQRRLCCAARESAACAGALR